MMVLLNHIDYKKVEKLLHTTIHFPEIKAVIQHNNPGEIYVDQLDDPQTALVWNQGMQGFYLIGDANNQRFNQSLNDYLQTVIIKNLIAKNIHYFEVSGNHDAWNKTIEQLFNKRNLKYGIQWINRFQHHNFASTPMASETFEIRKVNANTFTQNLSNINFIKDEIEQFWGTVEQFLDKGLAYYALDKQQAVSICYSGFKAHNLYAIGIKTLPAYRRQGYGYAVAKRFIHTCLDQGMEPYWDCMASNTGSKMLANKLGFIHQASYRCYWFDF